MSRTASRLPASPPIAPSDRAGPARRLRVLATILVALALLAAGGWKLWRPDPAVTMISRYLPSPKAARAVGCLEIAVALWLLSGRSPRLAPTVAAGGLAAMALLIGSELRRDFPLPCGCFPQHTPADSTAAVRRDLSVALGRDTFLILLCGLSGGLAPVADED